MKKALIIIGMLVSQSAVVPAFAQEALPDIYKVQSRGGEQILGADPKQASKAVKAAYKAENKARRDLADAQSDLAETENELLKVESQLQQARQNGLALREQYRQLSQNIPAFDLGRDAEIWTRDFYRVSDEWSDAEKELLAKNGKITKLTKKRDAALVRAVEAEKAASLVSRGG